MAPTCGPGVAERVGARWSGRGRWQVGPAGRGVDAGLGAACVEELLGCGVWAAQGEGRSWASRCAGGSKPGREERVGRRGEWVGRVEREREAGLGYFGLRVGFGLSFGLGPLLILSPFYFYF